MKHLFKRGFITGATTLDFTGNIANNKTVTITIRDPSKSQASSVLNGTLAGKTLNMVGNNLENGKTVVFTVTHK